eukprot:scaffold3581_cov252-Pinguiococcus_pyrenoidosus.AAC.25
MALVGERRESPDGFGLRAGPGAPQDARGCGGASGAELQLFDASGGPLHRQQLRGADGMVAEAGGGGHLGLRAAHCGGGAASLPRLGPRQPRGEAGAPSAGLPSRPEGWQGAPRGDARGAARISASSSSSSSTAVHWVARGHHLREPAGEYGHALRCSGGHHVDRQEGRGCQGPAPRIQRRADSGMLWTFGMPM